MLAVESESPLRSAPPRSLPKVCGADVEFGNFIHHPARRLPGPTDLEAATLLLREFPGTPAGPRRLSWGGVAAGTPQDSLRGAAPLASAGAPGFLASSASGGISVSPGTASFDASSTAGGGELLDPFDRDRKFLPSTGGSVYIDGTHLEVCLPEVLSAFDFVASWHAALRLSREALRAANARLSGGREIQVLVNNTDGKGHSFGGHLSFLITRRAWEDICRRKPHHLHFFASYLASSIVFTGSGKVGSENGAPPACFQLSQRADFFEGLLGEQTTYARPIVYTRDESLADAEMARLHVIFFDTGLSQVASLLKVGVTQLVLALLEQEFPRRPRLLDDCLSALAVWSRDPSLEAKARLTSGELVSALDHQWMLFEAVSRFVASGRAAGVVPEAERILAVWGDTLAGLERDVLSQRSRLDWVLKLALLLQARERQGLEWSDVHLRYLDQVFHSLDPSQGLFWAFDRGGALERVVEDGAIERFLGEPPEDTRAWTRAQILRRAPSEQICYLDWDRLCFDTSDSVWPELRLLEMKSPFSFTRKDAEHAFEGASSLVEILDRLEASRA